jgi:thymidylate kinase
MRTLTIRAMDGATNNVLDLNIMPVPNKIIIDGLDRLGKSTLIKSIRDELGYFEIVHFSKPQSLAIYDELSTNDGEYNKLQSYYRYQYNGFENMMKLLTSKAKIIFDRSHLGEFVYSPLYRSYSGEYVFDLERKHSIDHLGDIRLILLTEDFSSSAHFVDDGESLGPVTKRQEEQNRFMSAFSKSIIGDKRVICVTDKNTGAFRPKREILREALN